MDSEMSNVLLYNYFRSSCSWRIRAFLAFKGIKYEYKAVNLLKMEHKQEEFLKINPNGQVPALVYDGHVMSESSTILEFLEDMYPKKNPSLPSDLFQRQIVRQMCYLIGGFIQPIQNPFLAGKIARKFVPDDAEKQDVTKKEWSHDAIKVGFMAFEKLLQQYSGKCSFGDEITMADFFLVPQVANAMRFDVDLTEFPLIKRINETLLDEECFKLSHPDIQPDNPNTK
ncbi:maleylacetoacetate isomerase-like [Symsagittifera roscoffensis]|uniref:maleylacetoacetate isomerase-like n=1 Tax=Symsagittifera roscoffensis TaxID=84072 RepID=UPI00307C5D62